MIVLIFGSILTGCGYFHEKMDKNPPSQRQQQCDNLKNQMTLFQGAAGINTQSSKNPAQDAHDARLYNQYKCSDFEKK